jgi:hypothetical protein
MPDHWQAAAWFLERFQPTRWGRVDRRTATAKSRGRGDEFEVDLAKLSDEELLAIASGKANLVMNGKAYSGMTPADL